MLTYMDETEIQISHIEQIKMIHFYTLDGIADKITGVALFFNQNETINLCSFDPHFEMLVAKIFEMYSSTPEDKKSEIYADESTRKILNDSSDVLFSTLMSDYSGKITKESDTNFAYVSSKAYIECFLAPIVSFTMESIMSVLSVKYERLDNHYGWFGRGMFKYMIDKNETVLPYLFEKSSPGTYKAMVNNFIEASNVLSLTLIYQKDGICISFFDKSEKLSGSFSYMLKSGLITVKQTIKQDKREIFYDFKEIGPSEDTAYTEYIAQEKITDYLPLKTGDTSLFVLPWNQRIITITSYPDENADDFSENQVMYATIDRKQMSILTFFENTSVLSDSSNTIGSSRMIFQIYKDKSKKNVTLSYDYAGYNSCSQYKEKLQYNVFQFNQ